jgi:hypothetical protein
VRNWEFGFFDQSRHGPLVAERHFFLQHTLQEITMTQIFLSRPLQGILMVSQRVIEAQFAAGFFQ